MENNFKVSIDVTGNFVVISVDVDGDTKEHKVDISRLDGKSLICAYLDALVDIICDKNIRNQMTRKIYSERIKILREKQLGNKELV